ncbi:hypothetical protein ACFLU5_14410 [Bacteroidota bacterium]
MAQGDKDSNKLKTHFSQWKEIGNRMKAIYTPGLKQAIVKSHRVFQKDIARRFTEMEKGHNIARSLELPKIELPKIDFPDFPDLIPLTKHAQEYKRSIEELVNPVLEELQQNFRELPPRTQEALLLLGTHGWYLDLDMDFPELWKLKESLTDGNNAGAEETLVEYFDNRADEIEKSLIERFPNRQKIINAAFNAHRRQEYELSIPVLLAQTDGICKEISKKYYLFMKDKGKPQISFYVEQVASDTFWAALLSPLRETLPIGFTKPERERYDNFSELNRHLVIHGDSLDYGTKTNSLKAISLINYVAFVLRTDD